MRYFIIFYTIITDFKKGYGNFTWKDNHYPIQKDVRSFLTNYHNLHSSDECIITNIQEVNGADYEYWIKK